MRSCRPPLFWKASLKPTVIVTCARWYVRFCLSLHAVEELMAERRLWLDHTTVWRWTQSYGPRSISRLRGELKPKSSTWHMKPTSAFSARTSTCSVRSIAKARRLTSIYRKHETVSCQDPLKESFGQPSQSTAGRVCPRRPKELSDCDPRAEERRTCTPVLPAMTRRHANSRIESEHRHIKRRPRAMEGRRTLATAWAVI
jgi:transposase-like protein